MKRLHVYYSGHVHGVGFRYAAVDIARRYGIFGWVKNLRDGRVEVVAEGKDAAVQSFLDALNAEMAHHIRDKNVSWETAASEFTDFRIKF
ncbi:acylphosphatase [Candidatus Margulisiibacteriota bacterium]